MADFQIDSLLRFENELKRREISLQPDAQARVGQFFYLLDQANRSVNLTGYNNLEDWIDFHLLDALQILERIDFPQGSSVFDVGAGAGLPGVLLKCLRPDLRLIAVESVKKKADFIQSALIDLFDEEDTIIADRAETAAQHPDYRERGDFALARALGSLPVSLELTTPFVRLGGHIVLPRGEIKLSEGDPDRFRESLGCALLSTHEYQLPRRNTSFFLYLYKKTALTLDKYPRNPAQIKKHPL